MPKIRRKDRVEKKEDDESSSDESANSSIVSEAPTEVDPHDSDLSSTEVYEEKMSSLFDSITEKNIKTRLEALKSLRSGLSKRYAFDFLSTRSLSLCDSLDKCVRKGRGEEQRLAAQCQALLLLQLSSNPSLTLDLFNKVVMPSLKVVVSDESVLLDARCACIESLALCTFTSLSDQLELREIAQYIKDVTTQHQPPTSLQVSGLRAWSLLFTLLTSDHVLAVASLHLDHLGVHLESSSTELRIAAGQAVAVVFEAAVEADEDFEYRGLDGLCEVLAGLARESGKHTGKKDKKQLRASFREVLRLVEEGDFKEFQVSISKQEGLLLESWCHYFLYECLCTALGSGILTHLKENPVVREMFDLGDVLEEVALKNRTSKHDKLLHKSAFKQLTKHRQKQRSKKSNMADFVE